MSDSTDGARANSHVEQARHASMLACSTCDDQVEEEEIDACRTWRTCVCRTEKDISRVEDRRRARHASRRTSECAIYVSFCFTLPVWRPSSALTKLSGGTLVPHCSSYARAPLLPPLSNARCLMTLTRPAS